MRRHFCHSERSETSCYFKC